MISLRLRAAFVGALIAGFALIAGPMPGASAGEFTVRQCEGSSFQGFFGEFRPLGVNDRVDVVNGCSTAGPGKIGVYQDRNGDRLANGEGGQFIWDAPDGVEIFGTVFTARLNNINGIKAQLIGPSGEFPDVQLDEGLPHDGQQRTTRWTDRSRPRNFIIARLSCSQPGGCANAADGTKSYFEVTDVEFKSRDRIKPAVGGSGYLWAWGNDYQWHRGVVAYRIDAGDTGTGVASTYLLVNGLKVELDGIDCSGDQSTYASRFNPCPAYAYRTGVANTGAAPFQEGANLVHFCTADYAASHDDANQTCTAQRVVLIDNIVPAAPIALRPVGGNDWRAENGFEVTWRNPDGQRAMITEADYRLIRNADNSVIDSQTTTLGSEPSLPIIDLPQPGEYRVEVRLRDAAGNLGPPSSTTLRFDDASPGDVAPESPPGWISADELPFEQEIERAEAGGPSGVGGYAFTVSKAGVVEPCPSGVCGPLELSLNDGIDDRTAQLTELAEGSHWLSAVAASGARVSSESAGSTVLKVDKTIPVTTIRGVPTDWVNRPVTLTAEAFDSGSGMVPRAGDNGAPMTAIRAGSSAPYMSPGGSARFTVADEGVTQVEYWARDLAGNANDGQPSGDDKHAAPGTATVRIDRRPPTIEFARHRNPREPETFRAAARDIDSGLDFGIISFRPIESNGEFRELETTAKGSVLSARLPSDDLARGRYLLRAEATDHAGNVGDTTSGGSGLVVELPLKKPVVLTSSFGNRKRAASRSATTYGKSSRVQGRLTRSNHPLAGAPLEVEETFVIGSRQKRRQSRIRTDGTGRYSLSVKAGPSRTVQVRYPGSRTNQRVSSRELSLTVMDQISFRIEPRVLRNRGRVRMSGVVKGKGALKPARGKLVAIQYFDPTRSRWRPVEVLRADRRGVFQYSYRFRTIEYAQRILFRAVSLPESGWPFSPSTSRRQSVIIYPAG